MLRLSQRPLTAAGSDQRLYVGRDEEAMAVVDALHLGLNVLVDGPRGSGRTSFLHHLRTRRNATLIDARPWGTTGALLSAIIRSFGPEGTIEDRDTVGPHDFDQLSTAIVEQAGGEAPALILLDDPDPVAGRPLFAAFRDALWEVPAQWVVAIEERHLASFLQPPADAFFGRTVSLGPMSEDMARRLLRRRTEDAQGDPAADRVQTAIEDILMVTNPLTPSRLLTAAALAVEGSDPTASLHAVTEAQLSASLLGRTETMTWEVLRGLGAAHAGDEQLGSRLGLTRQRLQQLLSRLETAGLVASHREGKRKMYRAVVPETARQRA